MTNDELIEITEKMKDELLERGWTQERTYNHRTGNVCLAGAYLAATEFQFPNNNILFGSDVLRNANYDGWKDKFFDIIGTFPVHFNDCPGRTFDEIIDALNRMIKELQ